jgi:hypothetical protein
MNENKDIKLDITGLGIILYSEQAVAHISEDEDYFSTNYQTSEQVLKHVYNGTIVGIGTRSPGKYILKIRYGYPEEDVLDLADYVLILGIHVIGEKVFARDLYDLMEWTSECPVEQTFELEEGYYQLTIHSNLPNSKRRGDNQVIFVYFNKVDKMPKLKYRGVPTLWNPTNPNS